MVERWLKGLAATAVQDGLLPREQEEIVSYGLIWGYHSLASLLALICLGLLLGVLPTLMMAAFVGAFFRFVTGGAHFYDATRCLIYTSLSYTLAALVAKGLAQGTSPEQQCLALTVGIALGLFYGLWIVDNYVPVDTAHRPITSEEEKKKFRTLAFLGVFLIISVIILLTLALKWFEPALAIWLAFTLQLLSLTPMGVRFVGKLDRSPASQD